jgi:hypothetical protein
MQAIINSEPKGIYKIKFGFFTESRPVRSMDLITYRLLNLLLYSCFYFSNIVGILPNQNLSQYVCDGITCLKMLDSDFKELESELKKKEIKQPIIFLNMAMPIIYDVIKNYSTTFETSDKSNAFEQKVSQEIQRLISTFNNNLVNYQAENNKVLGIGKESYEALVGETHLPSEYDSNQYPFLKYFMFTEYPNEDILAKKNNSINDSIHKYPVISQYFLLGDNVRNLKHLLLTQSFSSKLIHYYSYKISREEARKKFIKEEIESMDNNEELLNEFERFLPLYNDLQHKGVQFKCRPPMKARQLSEESELAYFLNDDGQLDYGMHIAAINQKFIEWQNEFLNRISENLIPSHPLYFMKEGCFCLLF